MAIEELEAELKIYKEQLGSKNIQITKILDEKQN